MLFICYLVDDLQKDTGTSKAAQSKEDDPVEKRSILVSNIPDLAYSPERVRDRITIHFQRKRNGGGDVDGVLYPLKGCPQNAVVVFNDKQSKRLVPGTCPSKCQSNILFLKRFRLMV